jgi:curved DNA-binding protein CbpA
LEEDVTYIDYYEVLEISPNAGPETIERMFRHHARRYHPDNQDTGNVQRFKEVVEAHNTLRDPVKRAQYDVEHHNRTSDHRKLVEEAIDARGMDRDSVVQRTLMSILYVKCRRNIEEPGIGNYELEQVSGIPREHLDFHIWYLREKGWVKNLPNGLIAITVEGIDRVAVEQYPRTSAKLLKDQSQSGRDEDLKEAANG